MTTDQLHDTRDSITRYQAQAIRAKSFLEFEWACDNIFMIDGTLAQENGSRPANIRKLVMVRPRPLDMVSYANRILRGPA